MRNRFVVLTFLFLLAIAPTAEALAAGSSSSGSAGRGVLAFVADNQLHVATADGRFVRRITGGADPRWNPVWSPDGRQLVFERAALGQFGLCVDVELYTIRPDGSGETRVTDSGLGSVRCLAYSHSPTWSPDGRSLAFVVTRYVCYLFVACATKSDIHRVDRTGSGQRPLTLDGLAWDPAWSPDGRRIAFVRGGEGGFTTGTVWVMNADGSGQLPVGPVNVVSSYPAWSPDGRRIAFFGWYKPPDMPRTSFLSNPERSPLPSRIWVMEADGANARPITAPLNSSPGARAFHWSPDARWIAFADGDPTRDRPVWIVRSDGAGLRTIVRRGSNWDPTWSPDGRRIAFTRYEPSGGRTSVRVIGTDGRREVLIGTFGYAALPSWSPRG